MDEWNVLGASALPSAKVTEQREKYFKGVKFRTVKELLEDAKSMEIV